MGKTVLVGAAFKGDFEFCIGHWLSLEDGFTQSEAEDARAFCRSVILEGDAGKVGKMCGWFSEEARKIACTGRRLNESK